MSNCKGKGEGRLLKKAEKYMKAFQEWYKLDKTVVNK